MPDPLDDVEAQQLYDHGVGLAQRGDHVRGEQYITAAMEKGYPQAEALPMLLRICVASSRYASALHYAEPYLRDHPDDWRLRYLVATIHLGLGHPRQARQELERVINTAPDAPVPYYTLGMLHTESGEIATGRPLLERYLELAPQGSHAPEVRATLADPNPNRIERIEPTELQPPPPSNPPANPPAPSGTQPANPEPVETTETAAPPAPVAPTPVQGQS